MAGWPGAMAVWLVRAGLSALLAVAVATTSAANAAADGAAVERPLRKKPNVIILLADDLGIGQIGVYGSRRIATPRIDQLAREGIRFTQAYSGGPVCSPSRVSLYTGRDGRLLHGNTNAIDLRPEDGTIGKLLRSAGYETALIGKYGVGSVFGVNDPLSTGFTTWTGLLDNISGHRQYPEHIFHDREFRIVPQNIGGANGMNAQEMFTREAVEYISRKRDAPFFLVVSFTSPHAELAAPPEFLSRYAGTFAETPYLGKLSPRPWDEFVKFYPEPVAQPNATMAAMVTALDSYVGRIIDAVAGQGLAEDTLIIFTSDNGAHAEGGIDPRYLQSSGPYRGQKRDLFDGGIHVPMIVRWLGRVADGRVDSTPWSFADVLPTLGDLADADLAAVDGINTNGVSIAPIFLRPGATLPDRIIYWEFLSDMDGNKRILTQAARKGNYKAVRYGKEQPVQIYDILADPGETRDIARRHPGLIKEMVALFTEQAVR